MARRQRNKSQNHSSNSNSKSAPVSDKESREQAVSKGAASEEVAPTQNGNDPAWYARDPYLLRDAASYPFSYAFGKAYELEPTTWINHTAQTVKLSVPGILGLRVKPTIGFSDGPTSPANVAASQIYAFIRHMNSGRKNYDPVDVMMYFIAVANLYSYVIWCERLYSFAMTYSDRNRYINDGLFRINGVNPSDFKEHLADFRMWLNTFINKISVFAIPTDITYFNKMVFMFRDVVLENGDGNIKDQMYMFVPDGFYRFTLDADNMGMLDYSYLQTVSALTTSAIQGYGEQLLTGLFQDEDASLMSGDIFKVYGQNIIRIPSMDEFLALPLVHDPMILWQMKNSMRVPLIRMSNVEATSTGANVRNNVVDSTWSLGGGRTQVARPGCIFQDNNGMIISCERVCKGTPASSTSYDLWEGHDFLLNYTHILASDLNYPEPGVVMESSRLMVTGRDKPADATSLNNFGWVECGSFVVQEILCFRITGNGALDYRLDSLAQEIDDNLPAYNQTIRSFPHFRYYPLMYYYNFSSGNNSVWEPVQDINNYTLIEPNGIKKLHDCALLSLFYVPGVAKIS